MPKSAKPKKLPKSSTVVPLETVPPSNLIIAAIDQGVTGAIAVMSQDYSEVYDLPMSCATWLNTQHKMLAVNAFYSQLEILLANAATDTIVIYTSEQMQSMGAKTPARILQGLTEMAAMTETCFRIFCRERNIPLLLRKYQPAAWIRWLLPPPEKVVNEEEPCDKKEEEPCDKKKEQAKDRQRKKQSSLDLSHVLFPHLQHKLTRQKDHNRSEALLLTFVTLAELNGCRIETKLKNLKQTAAAYHANNLPVDFRDVLERAKLSAVTYNPLTAELARLYQDNHYS
jgi:hypothetical protein